MIDKKIIITAIIFLLIGGLLVFGYFEIKSLINNKYVQGYRSCQNDTFMSLWRDMNDDNCVSLPVPITQNNQTTIQNFKFCLTK